MTLIQKDLDRLTAWSQKWQLPLNHSKCGIMHIGNHNPQFTFYLNGSKVQILQSTSDLGIKYSGNLKFTEHASSIVSKTRKLTGFLLKNFFTREAKLTLFKICVRPTLEYCSFIFSSMNSIDRTRIESVQRSFTRRILGTNSNINYTARCKTLSLEPLSHRRLRHNLIFFYKIITGISFSAFSPQWNQTPRYDLRNYEATLLINKYQAQQRYKFFIVLYSKLWNKLPQNIRTTDSILRFKRLITTYLESIDLYKFVDDLPLNVDSTSNGLLRL
ncbi:Reverse transcriptase SjR1 [Schistosoma japonicum]|uniref:Reverse transcriptase SjR1 n=1 Tax=Schistosoma japonicum TaxID=6182 RepID=A0A4Z2DCA4_SCHJA|nr:Reverse transcriptase SjR1 [Schistosoma japonicum]